MSILDNLEILGPKNEKYSEIIDPESGRPMPEELVVEMFPFYKATIGKVISVEEVQEPPAETTFLKPQHLWGYED